MTWFPGRQGGKPVLNRLTYANVVSTIAISIALGGTSYAAITLPPDSVGASQIRSGAVDSSDIRDGAIQPADLSQKLASRLALAPQALGTTPFVPPRGSNACTRWAPRNLSCVDVAGSTKRLGFLGSKSWFLDCPGGSTFKLISSGSSLGFPVPAYTIDTTAHTYTGAAAENIIEPGHGLFTATNWTTNKHDFTPHAACVK